MRKYKLAILMSHPVQYQAPFFKELAKEMDLIVYFCWNFGIKKEYDAEFGKKIKWDIPLLDDYKYKFLKNYSLKPSSDFWGQINLGIIKEIYNLKKRNYNVILIFGWNSFANWLAFLSAFILGLPVLLRGENPLNQELLKSKWKIRIKKIVLGTLFKFISAFLYIGEENKKFYKFYDIPEEKLFFAPYAVDNERYIKENQKSNLKNQKLELRKSLNINKNDIVILFIGKLIEKKRPFDLLKAFEMLNTKYRILNTHLLYVGDGALRSELEKYAKEHNLKNIIFVGFKNQTKLPQYYAMADIFVLPSGIGETWGLVVNEAMCFGLPIIASDMVGCGPDLVKHGENGYIFSLGSIEKLSKYLVDLIKNKKKIKQFCKKSFEIIKNYSHKKDIEGILEALNFKYNSNQ